MITESVHLLAVINQNETLYIKRKAHSIFEIRNTTLRFNIEIRRSNH